VTAGLRSQSQQPRANLFGQIAVGDCSESQERSIVLDRDGSVAFFISDDGEVVVRTRIPRIECYSAPQKFSGIRQPACRLVYEREIDDRLDVVRFGVEGYAQLRGRSLEVPEPQLCDSQIVVGFCMPGRDGDGFPELPDRFVSIAVILIQQTEVVVHLRTSIVLLEQTPVLHQCTFEIADTLMIKRQSEVIGG
jgi:hypothetical protein